MSLKNCINLYMLLMILQGMTVNKLDKLLLIHS